MLFAVGEGAVRIGSTAFLTQIVARLAVGPSARAVERHLARDPSVQAA